MNGIAFVIVFALGLTLIIVIQIAVSSQFKGKGYWIASSPFWVLAGIWGWFAYDLAKWFGA